MKMNLNMKMNGMNGMMKMKILKMGAYFNGINYECPDYDYEW
jgi:hypothetical protein